MRNSRVRALRALSPDWRDNTMSAAPILHALLILLALPGRAKSRSEPNKMLRVSNRLDKISRARTRQDTISQDMINQDKISHALLQSAVRAMRKMTAVSLDLVTICRGF